MIPELAYKTLMELATGTQASYNMQNAKGEFANTLVPEGTLAQSLTYNKGWSCGYVHVMHNDYLDFSFTF